MKRRRVYPILVVGCLACWALPDAALAMRQYAAKQHRFMQRDPLGEAEGTNFYVVLAQSPFSWRDPSGAKKTCADAGLFEPGGACSGEKVVGCAVCDGEGGVLACLRPSKFPDYPLDSSGNCDKNATGVNAIHRCACVHEHKHRDDINAPDKGCGGYSTKCAGKGLGDDAACCDKCIRDQAELNAWKATKDCLDAIPDGEVDAGELKEWKDTANEKISRHSRRVKACEKVWKDRGECRYPEGCK